MKSFLLVTLGILLAVSVHAAVPSYQAFKGTGGIVITTNPPQGDVTIDGSAISNALPSFVITNNQTTAVGLGSSLSVTGAVTHAGTMRGIGAYTNLSNITVVGGNYASYDASDYLVFGAVAEGIDMTFDPFSIKWRQNTILELSTNTSTISSNLTVGGTNTALQARITGPATNSILRTGAGGAVVPVTIGSGLSLSAGGELTASGGGGTPAGVTESVQLNSAGSFAAAAGFQYNSAASLLINSNTSGADFLAIGNNTAVRLRASGAGSADLFTTNQTSLRFGVNDAVRVLLNGVGSAGTAPAGSFVPGVEGVHIGYVLTDNSASPHFAQINARYFQAQVYSNMTLHAARDNNGLITVTGTNQSWHINSGGTNMMLHFDTMVPGIDYVITLTNGASSMVLSNGSAGAWKWRGQRPDQAGAPLLTNGFFRIIVHNYGTYTNAWLDMGPGLDLVAGSNIAFSTNAAGTEVTVSSTASGGSSNFVVSSHGTLHLTNRLNFGAGGTYSAIDSGGFFQLFNPVSSVGSFTVAEATDAIIIGANGATPTVSFQAPVHVASNFNAQAARITNQVDAGSITNRGSYGGAGPLFAAMLCDTNVANVKCPTYGAVGDGTTDDTAAFQAALTNPVVYIPPGTYSVNPLTLRVMHQHIYGDGDLSKLVSRQISTPTTFINVETNGVVIENVWIAGTNGVGNPNFNQSSSPNAVVGLKFRVSNGEPSVRNVRFSDCFYGLWLYGTNQIGSRLNGGLITGNIFTNCNVAITTGQSNEVEFVTITKNTIKRCYRGFWNQCAANILFEGNMIHDCGDAGIRIEPNSTVSGLVRGHSLYSGNAVVHCTGGVNLQRGFNATFTANFLEGPITLASTTNAVFHNNFWESSGNGIVLAGGQANEFRDNRLTPASITNMSGWDFYNCTFTGNKRSVNTKAGWEPIWDFSTVTLDTNVTTVFLDFAPWHPYRHIIIPASATNVSLWATNLDLVTHPQKEKTIRVTFTTNSTAMGETRIQVTNLNVFPHRWTVLGEQTNGYPDLFKTNNNELELTFRAKTTNHVQSSAEYYR